MVFWIFAPIAVVSGAAMLLVRNPVHSALLLVVTQFCLAIFFLQLGSPFLFVVQIIVYAGAIMVLFLFVIMLIGVDQQAPLTEQLVGQRWLALLLGVGLIAEIVTVVHLGIGLSNGGVPDFAKANAGGNVYALARVLFGPYFFPFEVTSVLLIVAALGIMLLGKRPAGLDATDQHDDDEIAPAPTPEPADADAAALGKAAR